MIPQRFVMLEAMPLLPNGKIDRLALPAPEWSSLDKELAPARNPVEEVLSGIWAELLGINQVGARDNFFEMGGHSLLATQIVSRIRESFGIEIGLQKVFEKPTIEELAESIQEIFREDGVERIGLRSGAIRPIPRDKELPLSYAQRRLWFIDQLEPGNPAYNIPSAFNLRGELNIRALGDAFSEIMRRHEALRTCFSQTEEGPTQMILPAAPIEAPVIDLSELGERKAQAEALRLTGVEAEILFDLRCGRLLRVKLIRLDKENHVALVTMHHIASDAWSTGILARELGALYEGFKSGKNASLDELPIQYADYAVWQLEWLQGEALISELSYWREQLAGVPGMLNLPTDRPRPAIQSYNGATESLELSRDLTGKLKEISRREKVTFFMLLLSAFKILLYRYSNQREIVVGIPIANRNRKEVEGLIGFFLNTLVMRTNLSGNLTVRELIKRVREMALRGYAHQDLPFEKLVEELQPERSLSHAPLFQVMFILQNPDQEALRLSGMKLSPFGVANKTAKYDLTLIINDGEQALEILEYNTSLFDAVTMSRAAWHMRNVLEAMTTNLELRITELPLLTEPERRQLLREWNETKADYPETARIQDLIESQVERTPDAIAVQFDNEQLSYWDLNARSNRLARDLQILGVGPEARVGICVERSLEMVIGALGILKAGGAYLPLDPRHPKERVAFMIEDAGVTTLLTQRHLLEDLPEHNAHRVCLDSDRERIFRESVGQALRKPESENLAYVMYTSGSTGKPKGVGIAHRSVVNLLSSMQERLEVGSEDILLAVTTLSFDISGLELYLMLSLGGRVIVVSRNSAADASELMKAMSEFNVSVMQATPATWRMLLEAGWSGNKQLKILSGGEALGSELAGALAERGKCVWNLYGPTETTIWSTTYQVKGIEEAIPIGKPIANTQIYILNDSLCPAPIGALGEIYIGGTGVAGCYHNRPDTTAEKFIPDPYSGNRGSRLYKTGDCARYLADGNLMYLGRLDNQVKLRGYRIELGEIERALEELPWVRQAVVTIREYERGEGRLVAYLILNDEHAPGVDELRAYLKRKLPEYMTPSAYVIMDKMPLSPNGKIDRSALPAPEQSLWGLTKEFILPRTPVEAALTEIWSRVLGAESIGVNDNFFEIGGHSLLAVRLLSQIREFFRVALPMRSVFESPTVASMAALISMMDGDINEKTRGGLEEGGRQDRNSNPSPLVALQSGGSRRNFFCVHPVDGNIFCYEPLARLLGPDQPFYALQARGLDGEEEPSTEIETMASDYLTAVQEVQPAGPYLLGGWSMGGVVAFEMARQLLDRNEQIAQVILFDSFIRAYDEPFIEDSHESLLAHFALNLGLSPEQVVAAQENLRSLELEEQLRVILETAQGADLGYASADLSTTSDLWGVFRANMRAIRKYAPRPIHAPITLFKAGELLTGDLEEKSPVPDALAVKGLKVYEVPGNHFTMLRAPHLKFLAQDLNKRLSEIQGLDS
jgi:amino acid adenylation domain-containing protein